MYIYAKLMNKLNHQIYYRNLNAIVYCPDFMKNISKWTKMANESVTQKF